MNNPLHHTTLLLLGLLLGACSNSLDEQAYVVWVQDYKNGLHVRQEVGPYSLDLQYQPAAYTWLQRQRISTASMETAPVGDIPDEIQYYTLTIGVKDGTSDFIDYGVSSGEEKQRRLYYFSYTFQEDIYLEENGKRVPCTLFHFERSLDLKPSRTFVLGFEDPEPPIRSGAVPGAAAPVAFESQEARLVIEAPPFGSVPVNIKVTKANIPTLAL